MLNLISKVTLDNHRLQSRLNHQEDHGNTVNNIFSLQAVSEDSIPLVYDYQDRYRLKNQDNVKCRFCPSSQISKEY